jgi:hypothetical protein
MRPPVLRRAQESLHFPGGFFNVEIDAGMGNYYNNKYFCNILADAFCFS